MKKEALQPFAIIVLSAMVIFMSVQSITRAPQVENLGAKIETMLKENRTAVQEYAMQTYLRGYYDGVENYVHNDGINADALLIDTSLVRSDLQALYNWE